MHGLLFTIKILLLINLNKQNHNTHETFCIIISLFDMLETVYIYTMSLWIEEHQRKSICNTHHLHIFHYLNWLNKLWNINKFKTFFKKKIMTNITTFVSSGRLLTFWVDIFVEKKNWCWVFRWYVYLGWWFLLVKQIWFINIFNNNVITLPFHYILIENETIVTTVYHQRSCFVGRWNWKIQIFCCFCLLLLIQSWSDARNESLK